MQYNIEIIFFKKTSRKLVQKYASPLNRRSSFLFAGGQERIKFFCAKVNSRNSSISLNASCRRILVQLAAGQKQINLTRKRGAVFTGNHATMTKTKRNKRRRKSLFLSQRRNSLPMHLQGAHTHDWVDKLLDNPFSFEGGIGFNGTPLLFIFLGMFWPRSNVGPRGRDYL